MVNLTNEGRRIKCLFFCIKNPQSMEDEQTRRQKGTLNKMKKNCKNCKKAT